MIGRGRRRAPRDPRPQRRRGVQHEQVHVPPVGDRGEDVEVASAGIRVSPNSDSRGGRSSNRRVRRGSARTPPPSRSAGLGCAIRSRSRRHSSACHAVRRSRRPCLAARPRLEHAPAGATAVAVEQVGDVADARRTAASAPRLAARALQVARPAWPATARPGTRRPPRAAATPSARPATGRRPDRSRSPRPARRGSAARERELDVGAHAVAPARRWRRAESTAAGSSQRSIPRVGTATTSGVNGSSSGSSSVSARPSARRSARSAR